MKFDCTIVNYHSLRKARFYRRLKMSRKQILFFCALILVFFSSSSFCRSADINVSAAASLTNAFTELKNKFEKQHPGDTVLLNFAASNPLLRQIQAGAPADVFASADQPTMDKAAGAIDPASRADFASNSLVLIVPKGREKPARLEDLRPLKRIAVGNPDSVPAGRYARQSLEAAGLWDELASRFIFGENVRQVLNYVARGEADAGFVYGTDARQMADKVDAAMTMGNHDPVTYPIAVAITGNNRAGGEAFVKFALSPEGQAVLAKYGFGAAAAARP